MDVHHDMTYMVDNFISTIDNSNVPCYESQLSGSGSMVATNPLVFCIVLVLLGLVGET